MKRFSMLNVATGAAVYPRLFEPDGAVDADDRAFLLKLYGGIAFSALTVVVEEVSKTTILHLTAAATAREYLTASKTTTEHLTASKTTRLLT